MNLEDLVKARTVQENLEKINLPIAMEQARKDLFAAHPQLNMLTFHCGQIYSDGDSTHFGLNAVGVLLSPDESTQDYLDQLSESDASDSELVQELSGGDFPEDFYELYDDEIGKPLQEAIDHILGEMTDFKSASELYGDQLTVWTKDKSFQVSYWREY